MRILHTADLQLGARFTQFADQAHLLREARFQTLETLIHRAETENASVLIVAGDLFDDNQISREISRRAYDILTSNPKIHVLICPGNHDPYLTAGSVWSQSPWCSPHHNIHIFTAPESISLQGIHFIGAPLTQKVSHRDPSIPLDALALQLPSNSFKIGITHGSPDIPSLRQDNDFPIDLKAAHRAGLDLLLLGHWHGWQYWPDHKMLMPGSPEPDRFSQPASGSAALIDISDPDSPTIQKINVQTLSWFEYNIDLSPGMPAIEQAIHTIQKSIHSCPSPVLRIILSGIASHDFAQSSISTLQNVLLKTVKIFSIQDKTYTDFSSSDLLDLQSRSPAVASVLADIQRLSHLLHNKPDIHPHPDMQRLSTLNASELKEICESIHIDIQDLDPDVLDMAAGLILNRIRSIESL